MSHELQWIELDPDRHVSDCDRYDIVEAAYYWEDGTIAWSPRRLFSEDDEVVYLDAIGRDCPRSIEMTLDEAREACRRHAIREAEASCTCKNTPRECLVHGDVEAGKVRVVTDGVTVHLTAGEGVDLRDVLRSKGAAD